MRNNRFDNSFLDSLKKWQVRLVTMLVTIFAAILITMLLFFVLYPKYGSGIFLIFLCFPSGLKFDNYPINTYWYWGWFLYAFITVIATLAKSRKFFYRIYAILIIILILNIRGCVVIGARGEF